MKHESFAQGVMFMTFSVTGLALTGLLGKFGLDYIDLTTLIFWRFLTSLILCVLFMWWRGLFGHGIYVNNLNMHFLRAVFVISTQYCYYFYLQKNTLLNAMVLLNTGPLFIPVIEWAVLRQRVGVSTWVSVVICFVGVLFVLQPDKDLLTMMSLVGLLAGVTQAASQVVFGINSKVERSDLGVLYLSFFCAILSIGPFLLMGEVYVPTKGDIWILYGLIGLLGIASLLNQLFRAMAYQHATPSRLSPFMYIAVLLGGLWDWLFFHHIPNTFSIIGALLVVIGGWSKIYLRALILRRKNSDKK